MEIVNVYREKAPASRFAGIRYTMADTDGSGFGPKWGEWHASGRFKTLEALLTPVWRQAFPEAGSYCALMRWSDGGEMEYWIGMFLPPDAAVPEGLASLDFPAMDLGVCWMKGQEPEIYTKEEECLDRLKAEGFSFVADARGPDIVLERYQCPRYTAPDSEGNVILDIAVWVRPDAQSDPAGKFYCANCYAALAEEKCPECGRLGGPLSADDPIFIGELPGPLRNALQIAFSARDVPFTALPHMGSGFTMAAGDLLETWNVYVPFERSAEAKAEMDRLLTGWRTK